MIKSYDFLVFKMIEKTLPPKEGQLAGATIVKVLYLVVDDSYHDSDEPVFTSGCVAHVKDFYVGYLSAKDARSVAEGMFVRGMFDEKGKIKLIN